MSEFLLLILALACLVLAMAQMAELGVWPLGLVAAGLAVMLFVSAPTASQTSLAALGHWLALPQRRLDLAALLLVETLLYSQQALMTAQGPARRDWRWLAAIPPPSLLIVLFLLMVWSMLEIDGMDFGILGGLCALAFPNVLVVGALLLRRLLPAPLMRTGLRLSLYAAQLAAALWLARPVQQAAQFKTPAMWERLAVLGLIVLALMALGWAWQRGFIPLKRKH